MQNGFFIIPRAIEKYEVFRDMDSLGFYTVLKCSLRFRETYIDGVEVGVNQLLISKPELARRCNLTISKVRRMLKEFQEIGGIRCENIKNKYTLITFLEPFIGKTESDKGGKGNPPAVTAQAEEYIDVPGIEESNGKKETDNAVTAPKNDRGELLAYGRFHNVYLSADEYESLKEDFCDRDAAIEKFSAALANKPEDANKNHYAILYQKSLYEKEDREKQRSCNNLSGVFATGNSSYQPDPNASYDLRRAEARARASVPVLKKRPER